MPGIATVIRGLIDMRSIRVIVLILAAAGLAWPARAQPTSGSPPVSLFTVAPADPASVDSTSPVQQAAATEVDKAAAQKRGEFVLAPMPLVNPTIENGLSLVVGYLYRVDASDEKTAPSATMLAGFKTSNGSWMASAVQSLHLSRDRFRVLGLAAHTDINYAFFGIGQAAGSAGVSVELNQAGNVGLVEGLVRVLPNTYVGARYQIVDMTVASRGLQVPDGPTFPGIDADLRTASLGPRFDFDTRDNPFYAAHGTQVRGIVNIYGSAVGGTRRYEGYEASLNRYHAIGARNVFAWHAGMCAVDGPAPFYDLCLLGKNQDLRGYITGQYRDRTLLAAQAEWRTELWWRFGATVFVGGGQVQESFRDFTWNDILPGYGVGARFTLAKQNHVNLRVDYGWGKDSRALYIGVIEAF